MQYLQICRLNFILLSNSASKTYFVLIGFLAFFAGQIFLRSVTSWSLSKVSNENRRALATEWMRWLSVRTCKHMECLHVYVYDCLCVCLCVWVWECKLLVSELIRHIDGLIILSVIRTFLCFFSCFVWNCNLGSLVFHYVCT